MDMWAKKVLREKERNREKVKEKTGKDMEKCFIFRGSEKATIKNFKILHTYSSAQIRPTTYIAECPPILFRSQNHFLWKKQQNESPFAWERREGASHRRGLP